MPFATTAPTLLLTPHGHLVLTPSLDEPALPQQLGQALELAFAQGAGHGLFYLGATQVASVLPPVLAWWRDFAARYVTALCAATEDVHTITIAPPNEQTLDAFIADAPAMQGAEYLTAQVLTATWAEPR